MARMRCEVVWERSGREDCSVRSDYFIGLDKLLKWCFRGNCFALNFGYSRSADYMAFHCVASNLLCSFFF
jgi:hypothetical protein